MMALTSKDHRETDTAGLTQGEAAGIIVGVIWVVVVGLVIWNLPAAEAGGGLRGLRPILFVVAIFMPLALIWVAATSARERRRLREDILILAKDRDNLAKAHLRLKDSHDRLSLGHDELRQMLAAQSAMQPAPAASAGPAAAPAPAPQAAADDDTKPSGFTSRREVSRLIVPRAAPQPPVDQPVLSLDANQHQVAPPLERPDLIAALNFPDDEHDTEGFAALRRALRDRQARQLVQASQDVLTLLSQNGIYTDDLTPGPVPAEIWRRFARGERGGEVDKLGAIREPEGQITIAARMREDTIFRDAVHHFLRKFDQMLITFAEHATDTDLLALANTRTARAFMLLGRAAGTFD